MNNLRNHASNTANELNNPVIEHELYGFHTISNGIMNTFKSYMSDPISNAYNSHIKSPILTTVGNISGDDNDNHNDDSIINKIMNIFNNPFVKKILSIFILLLFGWILLKVSITKINDEQLTNTNVFFLNQCMWVWTILLIVIIVINVFT